MVISAFRGVFHGDPTIDGFSQTFEYLRAPGEVFFETFTFEDLGGGRSLLHAVSTAPSVAVRDGYEKLDELLASS